MNAIKETLTPNQVIFESGILVENALGRDLMMSERDMLAAEIRRWIKQRDEAARRPQLRQKG